MILELLLVFGLNLIASTMKILNTMFISKKVMKPVYVTLFIDACVFTYALKLVTSGDNFLFILTFAFGKMAGGYFANIVEDKMAIGNLEVSLYSNNKKAYELADTLRSSGFGVTTILGHGMKGKTRISLQITLKRKELSLLKEIVEEFGYEDATMVVREIKDVTGKIKLGQEKAQ